MPAMHIPEEIFAAYVEREGGYEAAKDAIQARVASGVDGER